MPTDLSAAPQRAVFLDRLLDRLCTRAGPHPSGTPAYGRVIKMLQRELASALPVAFLDRYLDFWKALPGPEILHRGKPLPVVAAENSGGTPDAGFTGVLRQVQGQDVRYEIVDTAGGEVGATVAVSSDVSAIPQYLLDHQMLSVPRFVLGIRDVPMADLLAQTQEQVQVRLRVVHAPRIPTYNAVGQLPGASPDEIVLVAHADTVIQSQGANDNTATAIIVAMLAHALGAAEQRCTLTFLITGSEEYGCCGARHYVRRRQAEGTAGRMRFVINCDSLTYGPNLWTTTDDAELVAMVRSIHADLALGTEPIYTQDMAPWMNDAACFRDPSPHVRGINFNSRGRDTLAANHTPDDTADNVPRDCAEPAFLVLRELLQRLQEI
jgi:hypothetical protein